MDHMDKEIEEMVREVDTVIAYGDPVEVEPEEIHNTSKINSQNPPKEMHFVLVRESDYAQEGEWFIPPASGILYRWNWPDPSKEKHPIYHLMMKRS
jgi:hypothetical protein